MPGDEDELQSMIEFYGGTSRRENQQTDDLTREQLIDALSEVVRTLSQEPDMLQRYNVPFTAWDIAQKTLRGQAYP